MKFKKSSRPAPSFKKAGRGVAACLLAEPRERLMKKVYIAGPMQGREKHNFPEFFRVEAILRDAGYLPINPARNDGGETADEAYELSLRADRSWEDYMRIDIAILATCDAICLLDDWWTSKGATCEQTIAAWLRMEVINAAGIKIPTTSLRG